MRITKLFHFGNKLTLSTVYSYQHHISRYSLTDYARYQEHLRVQVPNNQLSKNVMGNDRVLKRTHVPKRKKVVGGWRRLNNEELRYLYASPILFGRSSQGE